MKKKARKHARINDTLTGPLERQALQWLAAHSPTWATPDHYTSLGVLGSVIIFLGYVLSNYHPGYFWLANLGFVINWLGDSLDGTLARYRHIERPIYGFYIDHTTDAISQVLVFSGLGLSPYVDFNVAILALVAYLLLSVLVYVRTCVVAEFRISYNKLGPTEARLLAMLLNTAMFFFGAQLWQWDAGRLGQWTINPYDVFVGGVGLLLLYFFLRTGISEAIRLARQGR